MPSKGLRNGLINCFLFQKRCFDRWGLFDERFVYGKEDWDLHLKFSCGGAKYLFTKGEMARYRVSENSMVRRDPSAMSRGKKMVFKKYIFYPKSPRRVRLIFLKRYLLEILMK